MSLMLVLGVAVMVTLVQFFVFSLLWFLFRRDEFVVCNWRRDPVTIGYFASCAAFGTALLLFLAAHYTNAAIGSALTQFEELVAGVP